MAATVTNDNDSPVSTGAIASASGTVNLGTYATGGVAITPAMVGLGAFVGAPEFSAQGYTFAWVASTGKVLVYRSGGFTPAGTNSAPTITTDTNATTTTPVYTNGGALTQVAGATGITGVQAPVFTGTAVAATTLAEVSNGVDLSAVVVYMRCFGTF